MVPKVLLLLESFGMLNKIVFFIILIAAIFIFIQSNSKVDNIKEKIIINIPTEKCTVGSKVCIIETGELKIKISLDENIYYLKPFNVSVIDEDRVNSKLESVQVNFKMSNMNMGINRFRLKNTILKNNAQIWQGKALLPICVTGRADWISEFELETKNKKYSIKLPIQVKNNN